MYRGCCIEWDCLMMHRIKSVAFSWAPLSLSLSLSLSLFLPPLLSFTHTLTPQLPVSLPLSIPPFYLSLRLILHPPSSSSSSPPPPHQPLSFSLRCRLSWTVGHTLLCALLPNSINHCEGKEESVEGLGGLVGVAIKRIEIRYGWGKMSRMKTHIGCVDIEKLEGRRSRRRRRTPLTFNDPLCSMAVPNNSLEYCVNICMQSSYDYGPGYDCKMCWRAGDGDDNDDDHDDVILVLTLTVITWARWLPEWEDWSCRETFLDCWGNIFPLIQTSGSYVKFKLRLRSPLRKTDVLILFSWK